jgi:hypothetical protein
MTSPNHPEGSSNMVEREAHSDDQAVDRFAAKMKGKLAHAREKGRSGWDNPDQCGPSFLLPMLHDHIAKGDPVDVANYAMMLDHYNASTALSRTTSVQRARVKCDRPGCDWANGRAALHPTQPVGEPDGLREALALVRDMAGNSSFGTPYHEDQPIRYDSRHYERARQIAALASPPTNDEDRSRDA